MAPQYFISVDSNKTLLLNGTRPFYIAGANCYYLMTRAADASTLPDVLHVLDDLRDAGVNVVRTWAFADGLRQWNALQPAPGVFDERIFCALDKVIAECAARNIRVMFALTNFWSDYGGMRQYVEWSRKVRGKDLKETTSTSHHPHSTTSSTTTINNPHSFWSSSFEGQRTVENSQQEEKEEKEEVLSSYFYDDAWCQNAFRSFILTILTRTNSITGSVYKEDPTILGWSLANEPQCRIDPGCTQHTIKHWAHSTAHYIKTIDPNHLVFMDMEGFFNTLSFPSYCRYNPYDCTYTGCDFIADCSSPFIDVACFHSYPDLWLPHANEDQKLEFALHWMQSHIDVCRGILKKPVLLSEYGKKKKGTGTTTEVLERTRYFNRCLDAVLDNLTKDDFLSGKESRPSMVGAIFWTAAARSYPDYDGFTMYVDNVVCGKDDGRNDEKEEERASARVIVEFNTIINALNTKEDVRM